MGSWGSRTSDPSKSIAFIVASMSISSGLFPSTDGPADLNTESRTKTPFPYGDSRVVLLSSTVRSSSRSSPPDPSWSTRFHTRSSFCSLSKCAK